jgi:glycosyltransferase involved in cell wall biosynthesis
LLLVPPEDPSSAAAAVTRIATEAGLALLLRSNARHAAQQFSWPVIAQAHCDLYAR